MEKSWKIIVEKEWSSFLHDCLYRLGLGPFVLLGWKFFFYFSSF